MDKLEKLLKQVEHGSETPRWWNEIPEDAQEFLTILKDRAVNDGNIDNINVSKIVSILKDEWDVKVSYSAIRRYITGETYAN